MAQWATKSGLVTRVRARIQDAKQGANAVEPGDVDNVIEGALMKLSRFSPYIVVATMNGSALTAIQFLSSPATGTANIRVIYTAPHRVSDSATTVPAGPQRVAAELFGVCAMAEVYAARASHNVDSGIQGDAVDYAGQAERWHAVAEKACSEGAALLGAGDGIGTGGAAGTSAPFAAAWADVDPSPSPWSSLVWRSKRRR